MQRRTFLGSLIAIATLGKIPRAKAVAKTIPLKGGSVIELHMTSGAAPGAPEVKLWFGKPVSGECFIGQGCQAVAEDLARIKDAEILENHYLPDGYRSELVELMNRQREKVFNDYFEAAEDWMDRNIPLMPSDTQAVQSLLTRAGAVG